jgi:hypothetical protein
MASLASEVTSAAQLGQLNATGIWPLTGSTSNANRAPQGQETLTSMAMD